MTSPVYTWEIHTYSQIDTIRLLYSHASYMCEEYFIRNYPKVIIPDEWNISMHNYKQVVTHELKVSQYN